MLALDVIQAVPVAAAPGDPVGLIREAAGLEAAHHLLGDMYGKLRIEPRGPQGGVRIARVSVGRVTLDDVRFAMDFDAEGYQADVLYVGKLLSGALSCGSDGARRARRPGELFLTAQPGRPCSATVRDARIEVVGIPADLFEASAGTVPGRGAQPWRLAGHQPVSPQAAATWESTIALIRRLMDNPDAAGQPLLAASAARLLAAVALAAFPRGSLAGPTVEDRHDSSPATLRRAVAFIDEHAHTDITVADIAVAAKVTPRAVQLAFRRHLATTPTAYLRRVRLGHAHRDLAQATPGDGTTVTSVAYRWAFGSPSRFSQYYKATYGVRPSDTLQR